MYLLHQSTVSCLFAVLSQAELKVLSASDQAARGASPVSPSRPDASPSLASTSNLTGGDIKPSNSAQPKRRGAQAAANSTERFKGQHGGVKAPDPDSDVDSRPELHSNDCDSSPEASHVRANGAASSASGHSTSTSHAPANGQPFSCPPDSGSDESDSSPHGRHWSNDASPTSAAGSSSHAAMRGNALSGGSPASQELDQDAEASFAKSAHEDHSSQHPFHSLQQPQTKQSLDLAAVYFQQAFALLYRHDWERAVRYPASRGFTFCSAH